MRITSRRPALPGSRLSRGRARRDRTASASVAVRLRVRRSDVEYLGTVAVRPTSTGRIEIATSREAFGREADKAIVEMWTFRPLTGGE